MWGNLGRLGINKMFEKCPICGWDVNKNISNTKQKDQNQLALFNPYNYRPWYEIESYE